MSRQLVGNLKDGLNIGENGELAFEASFSDSGSELIVGSTIVLTISAGIYDVTLIDGTYDVTWFDEDRHKTHVLGKITITTGAATTLLALLSAGGNTAASFFLDDLSDVNAADATNDGTTYGFTYASLTDEYTLNAIPGGGDMLASTYDSANKANQVLTVTDGLDALTDVTIASPADGEVLVFDTLSGAWLNDTVAGADGEANTASNVGSGTGVFHQKAGVNLEFNALAAGSNVTLSGGAGAAITIAGSASGDLWGDVVDAIITPDGNGTRNFGTAAARFATGFFVTLDVTGNIIIGGTVDGRDVATDGAKLDGLESGSTADQTEEEIQDFAWNVLGGTQTGITVIYQDGTNDVDFVVGGLTTTQFTSANISQWTNNSGYITATLTNEQVQDIVGAMTTGNTETLITVTYQDGDGTIDFVVDNNLANYDNTSSGFITATLTNEQVQDFAWSVLGGTQTGITVTYQDGTDDVDFVVGGLTTTQFTSANVSQWTNDSGYITATLTNEQVEDIAGAMLTGNTETLITVTYQDADGTIDFVVDNNLANYDNTTSGFITATLTNEQVEDIVGSMLTGNTETLITVTYQDADGTIDFVVDNDLANYSNSTSVFITAATTDTLTNKTLTTPTIEGGTATGMTTLSILDSDSSHNLIFETASNLTVNRTLNFNTGDADRALTLGGDTTLSGGAHSGTNTGDQTTISGNAGTATALQTARTINGVSFNGTANITVEIDPHTVHFNIGSPSSSLSIGDGQAMIRIPASFAGKNLIAAAIALSNSSSSGLPTVQLRRKRSGSDVDMLSTKLSINVSATDSEGATTPAVIDTVNDDVAEKDQIYIDVDLAGTGATGLVGTLTFESP